MILVMNIDDPGILATAYGKYPRQVFGIAYCYVAKNNYRWLLEKHEDLFIVAHGEATAIGNEAPGTGLDISADGLADWLIGNLLPGGYAGSIYISACGTAPTFIGAVFNHLRNAQPPVKIYGSYGDCSGKIEPPGNMMWVLAQ
jgi:hypothetical protein